MNKQLVVAMMSIAMIASSCVSTPKSDMRSVASVNSDEFKTIAAQGGNLPLLNQQSNPRAFTSKDIAELASASGIKLKSGHVMTSNDDAFDQKLEMVQNAKTSIRMVYYIYAGDDSSSVMNKALIAKAQSGVPVTLMVDFVTNYKNMDLYSMLEREGKGNLRTYFYNVPTTQIIQDANYSVLPCPKAVKPDADECYKSKMEILNAMGSKSKPSSFAKILLAGLYGKNATALKTAIGVGAQFDPSILKDAKGGADAADKESLVEFAKIATDAIVGNSLIAKIKLSIAMTVYGDTLDPIVNELTGRLPIRSIEKNEEHGKIWDHITDYTHHKLLAVDGNKFQLGGRNVEDSYHMNQRVGSGGKYIFIDTDFQGETAAGGTRDIEASFDRIIKTPMVKDLNYVKSTLAFDFIANTSGSAVVPGAAEMAVGTCTQSKTSDVGGCILESLPKMPTYKSADVRINAEVENMYTSANRYQRNYADAKLKKSQSFDLTMSANDLATAEVAYLENFNYKKGDNNVRVLGSKIGSEAKNGKNIQAAWFRGLENSCRVSRDENREVRVVFHTAYLLMPSGMVHRIAKMMNGDFGDCSKVRITFITNSPLTTDLGPINVLARYQLGALFTHYAGLVHYKEYAGGAEYHEFFPKMEYYELSASSAAGQSLHTKTSLIVDDLIVGSANADVRSYYMDTNNAVLIRNAKELNAKYLKFIDGLKSAGTIEEKMGSFVGKTQAQLRAENEYMLNAFAKRWKQEKRLTPERVTAVLDNLDKAGAKVGEVTSRLIMFRGDFEKEGLYTNGPQADAGKFSDSLNDAANAYDNLFKVF